MEIRSDCLLLELFHFAKRGNEKIILKKYCYTIKEEEWIHKQK